MVRQTADRNEAEAGITTSSYDTAYSYDRNGAETENNKNATAATDDSR